MSRDIYEPIYGKCQDSLLFRTMLATVEQELEYGKKKGDPDHPFVCGNEWWSGGLDKIRQNSLHFELLHDVLRLADVISEDYAAQFGPRLTVKGPARASMKCPHILALCFDDYRPELCRSW